MQLVNLLWNLIKQPKKASNILKIVLFLFLFAFALRHMLMLLRDCRIFNRSLLNCHVWNACGFNGFHLIIIFLAISLAAAIFPFHLNWRIASSIPYVCYYSSILLAATRFILSPLVFGGGKLNMPAAGKHVTIALGWYSLVLFVHLVCFYCILSSVLCEALCNNTLLKALQKVICLNLTNCHPLQGENESGGNESETKIRLLYSPTAISPWIYLDGSCTETSGPNEIIQHCIYRCTMCRDSCTSTYTAR